MTYNITAVSNTTGILDFIQKIDKYIFCVGSGCGTGGLLGTSIVIIVFAILMINFLSNNKDFNSSLMSASFICTLLGGFMFLIGIIPAIALYISILVWAISVAFGSRK